MHIREELSWCFRAFSAEYVGYTSHIELGNKIMLPSEVLVGLTNSDVPFPTYFCISNIKTKRKTFCGVKEFCAQSRICYTPNWMMELLNIKDGDCVVVKNANLPKGTFTKIQPFSMAFTKIPDPRTLLTEVFSNFACISIGDVITVDYENVKYKLEIIECKPTNAISVIDTDIAVEFMQAKDYEEAKIQEEQFKENVIQGKHEKYEETKDEILQSKFPGKGVFVGSDMFSVPLVEPVSINKDSNVKKFDPRLYRINYKLVNKTKEKEFHPFTGKANLLNNK